MGRVYRCRPGGCTGYVGWVDPVSGQVYREQGGAARNVGRVEMATGRVYRYRFGPDDYLGRVDLAGGSLYGHRLGPDRYLGEVQPDGRIHLYRPGAGDSCLGQVEGMCSRAEGGAAFFLLLLPAVDALDTLTWEDPWAGKG